MAKSGTFTTTIRTGWQLRLVWNIDSQSIENNSSTVTAKVQLVSTGSSYTINSTATKNGSLTINGTKYSFTFSAALSGNQVKTIYSKTVTIGHNADGSKTCSFSTSCDINVTLSGTYYGTVTASGNGTFDTIARATTPTLSATAVDMGASITINMPRASSGFTHTLTYSFGIASGTIGSGLGTTRVWTIPLTLANQIPSSTSGKCTITCATYNGSTRIGSKAVSFTARVPANMFPTFSSVTIAEAVAGIAAKFGTYVQNKSRVKITISAAGAGGSTISSYKTTVGGKSYTGSAPTSDVLKNAGSNTISIVVTDSRGRTATTTRTISVAAYSSPAISNFSAIRSNADGAENTEGTAATIAATFTIASVGAKNTATYTIEQRIKGAATWTQIASGSSYSYNSSTITGSIFSGDSSFEIRLTISDYFGSVSKTVELPTAFTLIDCNASGRAIAFGKVSQLAQGIEIGLPLYSSFGEMVTNPIALPDNTDLNSVTATGHYVIPTSAVSRTLLNKPTTGSGTAELIVTSGGIEGQRMQRYFYTGKDEQLIWQRAYFSASWGEWRSISGQNLLWSGGMYMTAGHTAALGEPISKQTNGVVLVFSKYASGAQNNAFHSFFVARQAIARHNGAEMVFLLGMNPKFETIGCKMLYIYDDRIVGHADNSATGTGASGIKYANNNFVLRYVIGV